jgi:hypothetical protein
MKRTRRAERAKKMEQTKEKRRAARTQMRNRTQIMERTKKKEMARRIQMRERLQTGQRVQRVRKMTIQSITPQSTRMTPSERKFLLKINYHQDSRKRLQRQNPQLHLILISRTFHLFHQAPLLQLHLALYRKPQLQIKLPILDYGQHAIFAILDPGQYHLLQ